MHRSRFLPGIADGQLSLRLWLSEEGKTLSLCCLTRLWLTRTAAELGLTATVD